MTEYKWFFSVIKNKIDRGQIKNTIDLSSHIEGLHRKGLSEEVGDKLHHHFYWYRKKYGLKDAVSLLFNTGEDRRGKK